MYYKFKELISTEAYKVLEASLTNHKASTFLPEFGEKPKNLS